MAKVTVRTDLCKGCALCVDACPKGIVGICKDTMNKKGCYPACVTEPSKCTACSFCAIMCPDCVIKVEK